MERQDLNQKLIAYAQTDIYPFHMPGHKRQMHMQVDPYAIDITEIDGFDNLHDAKEVIKDAQELTAKLYGAQESYFLINGSTCGILTAMSAAVPKGKKIIVARNCHHAVYHAIYLREYEAEYIYPQVTSLGISAAITPQQVAEMLQKNSDAKAVVITSPTYEGIVSDINEIAKIVHAYNIPLIVDEAHGAHFGFYSFFPQSAVTCGADVVIQSMHKTLPSYTQTAILHNCSNRVSDEKIKQFLDIYQTSSPSYVLMAGMVRCLKMIQMQGIKLFSVYEMKLKAFYRFAEQLNHIRVLNKSMLTKEECFDLDLSKIVIFTGDTGLQGKELYDLLLQKFHLQMEMASGNYVLAMTSLLDTDEGMNRLKAALLALDRLTNPKEAIHQANFASIYHKQEKCVKMTDALDAEALEIELQNAKNMISATEICLYPPGIPIIVPGEKITQKLIDDIKMCENAGLNVQGLSEHGQRIKVVNPTELYYT